MMKLVYENVNDVLRPKHTGEITSKLNLVKSINDLIIGDEYYVLDLGMNIWMKDLVYIKENDLHVFDTLLQFDDFSIQYTTDELLEAINEGEIAYSNDI